MNMNRVQSSVLPAATATHKAKRLEETGIEDEICVLMEFSSCSSASESSTLNQRYVHICLRNSHLWHSLLFSSLSSSIKYCYQRNVLLFGMFFCLFMPRS